ncbi:MAG: hypothetical protein ACTSWP_09950 [Candidatus Freyarchaeota archaeon]
MRGDHDAGLRWGSRKRNVEGPPVGSLREFPSVSKVIFSCHGSFKVRGGAVVV